MSTLKNYADIAHKILNSETQYLSNKDIISSLFKGEITNDFESVVKNRITIIDSYYSTQMSKRLYGIDELATTIANYPDDVLKNETTKFLNNPNKNCIVNSLFIKEYGIDKSGKPFGKSISLISKYLFFLNNGDFPIYDSLAIDSYKLLKKNSFIRTKIAINEDNYFDYIKHLNSVTNINDYEKLDNLLWLIGKLSKGSFSFLMNKSKYQGLIKDLSVKLKSVNSKQKDNLIRQHIKVIYQTSDLFTDNQKTFFEFVFSLS
ncbi:MAG: hypothetical protein ABJM06_11855 [Gilvibacter sp.]